MYRSTMGHADGRLCPVNLLISDHALYILSGMEKKTYKKKATIAFREIDYIAVRYLSYFIGVWHDLLKLRNPSSFVGVTSAQCTHPIWPVHADVFDHP